MSLVCVYKVVNNVNKKQVVEGNMKLKRCCKTATTEESRDLDIF